MDKNIFILCGEASGDIHASNLVLALKKQYVNANLYGWGGKDLEKSGVKISKELNELSFMGFWEVASNIFKIKSNFRECKKELISKKISTIILVDYPGFNLRIAKWAKNRSIQVVYYISPQVWAWKKSRLFQIKKYVDIMYCILPFEKEFYKLHHVETFYFGHPLLDEIEKFKSISIGINWKSDKPIMALLPGSRKQEIEKKLPIMIRAALAFKEDYEIIVGCASSIEFEYFAKYNTESIQFMYGKTYELLSKANIALVTSGTATLETALFKVPQVVCYKSSWLSYVIAKKLIKVKYISLVNIILNNNVVNELIQGDFNEKNLIKNIREIEEGSEKRTELIEKYKELVQLLGYSGASERIASHLSKKIL